MSDVVDARGNVDLIVDALLEVPELSDSGAREALAGELRSVLHRPFDSPRPPDSRDDLVSLTKSCMAYSGGLRTLAALLRRRYPGEASSRVAVLVDDLVGASVLSPADRESLSVHLTAIGIVQVADALGELVGADELRSLQSWKDIPAAIRVMERLPLPGDGISQLLKFTSRLASVVGEPRSVELRQWINMVAGGLGADVTTLAVLGAKGEHGDAGRRQSHVPSDERTATLTGENQPPHIGVIWGGGVPIRNRNFIGRVALLNRLSEALRSSSKASVLPQTLQGMGGVGKTQLVVEYVYRNIDEYDLVWWIPAEHTSSVLTSLSQLAERLGLTTTVEDPQQTARTVLDALSSSDLAWLLVYDNADDLGSLDQFIPSTGGHVVLTSRNQEWATVGQAIEVDVFERHESVELLQRRTQDDNTGNFRITIGEADELADKLGDLPLALEQAAAWHLATAMPINEYLTLLDTHIKDLLSEGKPPGYPVTVAAFVNLAIQELRSTAPATAQLFELFAYLGGQPIAVSLLRDGKNADVSEPLREMLGAAIPVNRAIRTLSRYGLAKVDPTQRIQVHRLVQRVLRDSLPTDLAAQAMKNVQVILAAANPGDPDEQGELHRQRELGPHIEPADLIHAESMAARQTVLDHTRYLYLVGDYENSRRLALQAAEAWEQDMSSTRLGPDGDLTLVARARAANAMRTLGDSGPAALLARDTYDRLRRNPDLGPQHEITLITGNQIGHDLRIQGRYQEALDFDQELLALHREVFGPTEVYTLRAQSNLAVDQRMVGNFAEALRLDRDVAAHWETVGAGDHRALSAYINMARSYYGMGAYQAGLDVLERWRSPLLELVGPRHSQVLLAGRTHAILLRKAGRLSEAAEIIQENQERVHNRFGLVHEFSVAINVSYANVLRELGELDEAMRQLADTLPLYEENFGSSHPLTLVALVNQAILFRACQQPDRARELDQHCYRELTRVLAPDHPYTVCAGASLATDYALAGEHEAAAELSRQMLELSTHLAGHGHEARGGARHPYALMRAINLAHDLRAIGDQQGSDALFAESIAGLREALGEDHPQITAIEQGQRTEGDIESTPT
ncbi:FxSxx-COOH system tetratricopeptide repeat protein [Allorhizocola rhizosphaerae]|uniref:FxSxx-COOH system tetratricopeptide repeat protein n=1 Tax=Allorhizocola rhizosphaerae TaxID=1872709 RepID=UPI000E3D910B|nr:FxSxx-COOH system tetratricopeptide repeat protein [Allorhizocola rhizosphaerae]